MNPQSLRYFLDVARFGSFRRAGDALNIAPSAVNRQISLLEDNLRVPLFERARGRGRLRLTAAGEILIVHAREVMDQIEKARAEIEHLKGLRTGTLTLGLPETFSHEFIPDFVAQFQRSYPGVAFRTLFHNASDLVSLTVKDECEIALIYNVPLSDKLVVHARIEQQTVAMVRLDHPLAGRSFIRLSDLADYSVIAPDPGTSMHAAYERFVAKVPPRLSPRLTSNSFEMMRSGARAGLGVAIVTEYIDPIDRRRRDVAFIPIRDPTVKPNILSCCTRRGRRLSVAANVCLDKLKEALATLRPGSK